MAEPSPVKELRREASTLTWQIIEDPADAEAVEKLLSIETRLEDIEKEAARARVTPKG